MSEQNLSVLRSAYEAFGRGDIPAVLAVLDPAIEWYCPEELPFGGRFHGPEEVLGFFQALAGAYDTLQVLPDRFLAAGPDTVVVEGRDHVTARGDEADIGFAHVVTMRDGRVTGFRQYADTGKILALLGHAAAAR